MCTLIKKNIILQPNCFHYFTVKLNIVFEMLPFIAPKMSAVSLSWFTTFTFAPFSMSFRTTFSNPMKKWIKKQAFAYALNWYSTCVKWAFRCIAFGMRNGMSDKQLCLCMYAHFPYSLLYSLHSLRIPYRSHCNALL